MRKQQNSEPAKGILSSFIAGAFSLLAVIIGGLWFSSTPYGNQIIVDICSAEEGLMQSVCNISYASNSAPPDNGELLETRVAEALTQTAVAQPPVTVIEQSPTFQPPPPTISPTATAVVLTFCNTPTKTGMDTTVQLNIDVPEGYVQYLGGTGFDDYLDGGAFVSITGPYSGTHLLYQGAYCPPVLANSPADNNARTKIYNEIRWGGFECPNECENISVP